MPTLIGERFLSAAARGHVLFFQTPRLICIRKFNLDVFKMQNLTPKELSAIEDQLGHEKTLITKYNAMAVLCSDTQIADCLRSIAQCHTNHYNQLITFIQ